jgi:lipopolysaccharide transport system ATP-binding protein
MSDDALVKVEGVSKKFCRGLKRSLWYGVQDLAAEVLRRDGYRDLRWDEFWAIKDVSFELRGGETLGIIGVNGAGKTTLLRMINGLIKPDRGKITVRGRVGALIALGAGFNPILTGRENIYVNAAVLGLSKREADRILDDIIDFADIGDFIDTPVQSYSSGMRVRLGFSVAAHLSPHVLLIDEVLSVGDFAFREKSFAHMTRICNNGAAVIFVSHSMAAILTICHRALWLEQGKIRTLGPAEEVVKSYLEAQEEIATRWALQEAERSLYRDDQVLYEQMRITKIELMNQDGLLTTSFRRGDDLHVRIHYMASRPIPEPHFIIHVGTHKETLFVADMLRDDIAPPTIEGEGAIDCVFYDLPLLPNRYVANVFVLGKTPIIRIVFPPKQVFFNMISDDDINRRNVMSLIRRSGLFPVATEWRW